MSDSPAPSAPTAIVPGDLRVGLDQLPACHGAVAHALGEAGFSGQELHALFATGLRATCAGCGLTLTGEELGRLAVGEGGDSGPLPPKLERLRLGFCPRHGCEARFYQLQLEALPHGDAAQVLARTHALLRGDPSTRSRRTVELPSRRQLQRLALIAGLTLLAAFGLYRLVFYRTQLIPFLKPASPFQVDPASVEPPVQR